MYSATWHALTSLFDCIPSSRRTKDDNSKSMKGAESSVRSLVCDSCWNGPFSQKSFRTLISGQIYVYSTTWSRIQQAVDRGCEFCSLLIVDKENHKDDVSFHLEFGSVRPSASGFQSITPLRAQFIQVEIEGNESDMSNNAYYLYTTSDDPAALEIIAKEPLRDVRSPRSFSLALNCLQDCITNHPTCPKPQTDTRLPTRVLDCADPSHPKLFTSQGRKASYVALSYVWGGQQPNCTTTENFKAYVAGINIEHIPKTIQDAIQATNKFGIRYLWVDAFCIIQDSTEDKKKELVQLRRIFRDAYFTIIASCAESAFAGFLHDRPPPQKSLPRLPFWCQDGRLGIVSTQPMFTPYDATSEPVNQRAWCLEERLLSARKIVYASDTLHYHCQSAVTSIGSALSVPRNAERLPDVMFVPDADMPAHVAGWKHSNWREVNFVWADVIGNYTGRAVTKPKDKLTALAGVAEQFDRVWHSSSPGGSNTNGIGHISRRYLAGLWGRTLMRDLLWLRAEGSPSPRPNSYLAPSWSWASVHGKINLYRAMDRALDSTYLDDPSHLKSCEILDCNVVVEDERLPRGRVKSGVLNMRAKVISTTWTGNSYDSEVGIFMGENIQGDPILMEKKSLEKGSSLRCMGEVHVDSVGELEGKLRLVFVIWNISPENTHAAGLLLTDATDGRFMRVGFWETPELLDDSEEDRNLMLSWFSAVDNNPVRVLEII